MPKQILVGAFEGVSDAAVGHGHKIPVPPVLRGWQEEGGDTIPGRAPSPLLLGAFPSPSPLSPSQELIALSNINNLIK